MYVETNPLFAPDLRPPVPVDLLNLRISVGKVRKFHGKIRDINIPHGEYGHGFSRSSKYIHQDRPSQRGSRQLRQQLLLAMIARRECRYDVDFRFVIDENSCKGPMRFGLRTAMLSFDQAAQPGESEPAPSPLPFAGRTRRMPWQARRKPWHTRREPWV